MIDTEEDTRHVKSSQKKTPPKAKHKHEYFRAVYFAHIRFTNGTLSERKHKFSSAATCVDCGHVHRRAYSDAVEIEMTRNEFLKNFRIGK